MRKTTSILFFTLSFSLVGFAQLEPYKGEPDSKTNSMDRDLVRKEYQMSHQWSNKGPSELVLDDDITKFINMVDSMDASIDGLTGYRIQLFSNAGPKAKQDAFEKQGEFIQAYPDFASYTLWNSPNWVLRVGDFRSRLEARQFLNEIKLIYPAAFIVSDNVVSQYKD